MKLLARATLCLGLALAVVSLTAGPVAAQTITTGTLSGAVADQQGGVLQVELVLLLQPVAQGGLQRFIAGHGPVAVQARIFAMGLR